MKVMGGTGEGGQELGGGKQIGSWLLLGSGSLLLSPRVCV